MHIPFTRRPGSFRSGGPNLDQFFKEKAKAKKGWVPKEPDLLDVHGNRQLTCARLGHSCDPIHFSKYVTGNSMEPIPIGTHTDAYKAIEKEVNSFISYSFMLAACAWIVGGCLSGFWIAKIIGEVIVENKVVLVLVSLVGGWILLWILQKILEPLMVIPYINARIAAECHKDDFDRLRTGMDEKKITPKLAEVTTSQSAKNLVGRLQAFLKAEEEGLVGPGSRLSAAKAGLQREIERMQAILVRFDLHIRKQEDASRRAHLEETRNGSKTALDKLEHAMRQIADFEAHLRAYLAEAEAYIFRAGQDEAERALYLEAEQAGVDSVKAIANAESAIETTLSALDAHVTRAQALVDQIAEGAVSAVGQIADHRLPDHGLERFEQMIGEAMTDFPSLPAGLKRDGIHS